MTAPRFYSWDDDGSPGRALTGNLQNRLKQILVACLVNGYGSKPAAGWTLEHEHANGFAVSNGDGFVNFVSGLPGMSAEAVHVYIAESITDNSNAIISGANLRSSSYVAGVNNDTNRHAIAVEKNLELWLEYTKWHVLANDKTVSVHFFLTESNLATFGYYESFSFGNFKSCISVLMNTFGFFGGSKVHYGAHAADASGVETVTVLRDPQTGFIADAGINIKFTSSNLALGDGYLSDEITIIREGFTLGSRRVGYLPGVGSFLEFGAGKDYEIAKNSLGILTNDGMPSVLRHSEADILLIFPGNFTGKQMRVFSSGAGLWS